jgi:hypothetical protein
VEQATTIGLDIAKYRSIVFPPAGRSVSPALGSRRMPQATGWTRVP